MFRLLRSLLKFALVILGIATGIIPLLFLFGVIKVVKVQEATAVAFKYLGSYRYCAMELKGHHFDCKGFIEADDETHHGLNNIGGCWCVWRTGGWVFYLRWLVEPTTYTHQNDEDGFGKDFAVYLHQIQRDFVLQNAETKEGEEIPLNLKAAYKMKVVNVYLFLFISPANVIAKVTEIMEAITRGWVKGNEYETIQNVKTDGGKMWKQLGADAQSTIEMIKDEWGLEILTESILIMDVGLTSEDQQAFAERKRQKLRTAAAAQEIVGGMLENAAVTLGVANADEARQKLQETPQGQEVLRQMTEKANQVVTQRALGIKPTLFGNADGSPLDPLTATLASLLTLARGTGSVNAGEGQGKRGINLGGIQPGPSPSFSERQKK